MSACLEDVLHVNELPLVELSEHLLVQDIGKADDRVQRGPQLVRHVRDELRLVPADRFELSVQPPELVVHPVLIDGQRAELVTVADLDMPREVTARDLGEARLRAPDRPDERPRENGAEQKGQDHAPGTDSNHQIARRGVRAAVLSDQCVRLRACRGRELVGQRSEVVVDVDHVGQERSAPAAGRSGAVEDRDPLQLL